MKKVAIFRRHWGSTGQGGGGKTGEQKWENINEMNALFFIEFIHPSFEWKSLTFLMIFFAYRRVYYLSSKPIFKM